MNMINLAKKSIIVVSIAGMTACNSDNFLPKDTSEIIVITKNSEFVLLNNEGKPILSCEEREKIGDKCRAPAGEFKKLCQADTPDPGLSNPETSDKTGQVKDVKLGYCIFEFKINPTCRTYVNRITGREYEKCW
ncbi:hypothetical protein GO003_023310 [Methylicorpusculum oleiharenae]|uniref:hypothetical protein n=1 Tax=Methylicorpusculum oleiharenae TaxID=1338687 RepID=UPI00135A90CC|nr:hypothetical protein [Methylicorpusculum oleiharenae]MCD2453314.1 hypothetical protein [Methylicorpusculum oleiharenae]